MKKVIVNVPESCTNRFCIFKRREDARDEFGMRCKRDVCILSNLPIAWQEHCPVSAYRGSQPFEIGDENYAV